MINQNIYNTKCKPTWCSGCGNFGIFTAIKNALFRQNLNPYDIIFTYGIGCNSNMFNTLGVHGFESLHGRPIPVAEGIKTAASDVQVVAIGGDGDTYGEGMNHLIHAARRNTDITVLVHNNMVYALTTGQTSPTSQKGFKTKTTPFGNYEEPLNPIAIAISAGATFVARGYALEISHLTSLIVKAMEHKGFSFVDILQPCVSFNKVNTASWYKERIYKLEETNFKTNNKSLAWKKSFEGLAVEGKIPIGLFFEEEKPTLESQFEQIKNKSLRDQTTDKINLRELFKEFI